MIETCTYLNRDIGYEVIFKHFVVSDFKEQFCEIATS